MGVSIGIITRLGMKWLKVERKFCHFPYTFNFMHKEGWRNKVKNRKETALGISADGI
jgi:hypothetical protein